MKSMTPIRRKVTALASVLSLFALPLVDVAAQITRTQQSCFFQRPSGAPGVMQLSCSATQTVQVLNAVAVASAACCNDAACTPTLPLPAIQCVGDFTPKIGPQCTNRDSCNVPINFGSGSCPISGPQLKVTYLCLDSGTTPTTTPIVPTAATTTPAIRTTASTKTTQSPTTTAAPTTSSSANASAVLAPSDSNPADQSPQPTEGSSNSLSSAALVSSIVAGTLVSLVILVAIVFLVMRQKNINRHPADSGDWGATAPIVLSSVTTKDKSNNVSTEPYQEYSTPEAQNNQKDIVSSPVASATPATVSTGGSEPDPAFLAAGSAAVLTPGSVTEPSSSSVAPLEIVVRKSSNGDGESSSRSSKTSSSSNQAEALSQPLHSLGVAGGGAHRQYASGGFSRFRHFRSPPRVPGENNRPIEAIPDLEEQDPDTVYEWDEEAAKVADERNHRVVE